MLALVKASYEIRVLRGRRNLGLAPAAEGEMAFAELERRLRAGRRLSAPLACSFKRATGQIVDAALAQLTPDGALLLTRARPEPGARISLKIRDEDAAREYHFPGEVIRASTEEAVVRLVGIPVECRYQSPAPPADVGQADAA